VHAVQKQLVNWKTHPLQVMVRGLPRVAVVIAVMVKAMAAEEQQAMG
jgi:hypothetical protein